MTIIVIRWNYFIYILWKFIKYIRKRQHQLGLARGRSTHKTETILKSNDRDENIEDEEVKETEAGGMGYLAAITILHVVLKRAALPRCIATIQHPCHGKDPMD